MAEQLLGTLRHANLPRSEVAQGTERCYNVEQFCKEPEMVWLEVADRLEHMETTNENNHPLLNANGKHQKDLRNAERYFGDIFSLIGAGQ